MGRGQEAERCFEEALAINPGYVDARKKLAHVCFQRGDHVAAERHVRTALSAHADYADLHKILGDVRMQAGDAEGARAAYARAATINPDYADAVFGLVVAMRRDGRGREADATLRRFLARHPEDAMARTLLAVSEMPLAD
jgi:tetratricopeptide (TPR) repeat protein